MVGEAGVGGVDAIGAVDDGFSGGEEAGDGKGHGDAVISVGVDGCTFEWGAAVDGHAVGEFLDLDAHFAESLDGGGDAIGFLYAEFFGVADVCGALCEGGGDGDDGDFIDEVGDFLREEGGAGEGCAVEFNVADGFTTGAVEDFGHFCAHAGEDFEDGGAGGIEADVLDEEV